MAVENENSLQVANLAASPPVIENTYNLHGSLRIAYFSHIQAITGAALSTVLIVKLPPGKIRLLCELSRITHNWTISTVDMDVGWKAYTDLDGAAVVANDDGIDADIDVDTAGSFTPGSELTAATIVFESRDGVDIELKAQAVGITALDTVSGYLVYIQD